LAVPQVQAEERSLQEQVLPEQQMAERVVLEQFQEWAREQQAEQSVQRVPPPAALALKARHLPAPLTALDLA